MSPKSGWLVPAVSSVILGMVVVTFAFGFLLAEVIPLPESWEYLRFLGIPICFVCIVVSLMICLPFAAWSAAFVYQRGSESLAKAMLFCSFAFPPIAYFISIFPWLGKRGAPVVNPVSAREAVRDMVESPPIRTVLVILFILLTAVTILGGVIFFAQLYIWYRILLGVLGLMPDPGYGSVSRLDPSTRPAFASTQSSSATGGGYTSASYDDDDGYDDYERALWEDAGGDRDEQDRDGGSMWDGWFFKH